mmetsp:Transcript_32817/g.76646  ORF Transcript_32817/g.76646 Transcript_32817/m.76646 type:complete len:205 (-) Transcript_32817:417-1031(-)
MTRSQCKRLLASHASSSSPRPSRRITGDSASIRGRSTLQTLSSSAGTSKGGSQTLSSSTALLYTTRTATPRASPTRSCCSARTLCSARAAPQRRPLRTSTGSPTYPSSPTTTPRTSPRRSACTSSTCCTALRAPSPSVGSTSRPLTQRPGSASTKTPRTTCARFAPSLWPWPPRRTPPTSGPWPARYRGGSGTWSSWASGRACA